jgi:hypothetical protein
MTGKASVSKDLVCWELRNAMALKNFGKNTAIFLLFDDLMVFFSALKKWLQHEIKKNAAIRAFFLV